MGAKDGAGSGLGKGLKSSLYDSLSYKQTCKRCLAMFGEDSIKHKMSLRRVVRNDF